MVYDNIIYDINQIILYFLRYFNPNIGNSSDFKGFANANLKIT